MSSTTSPHEPSSEALASAVAQLQARVGQLEAELQSLGEINKGLQEEIKVLRGKLVANKTGRPRTRGTQLTFEGMFEISSELQVDVKKP